MTIDFKKLAAAAAAVSPDLNEAASGGGGGDYAPPAEGVTRVRFVGYVETGKHTTNWQGNIKTADKVDLVFELSGPKHAPKVLEDGTKVPHRVTVKGNAGRNYGALDEKANLYKIFRAMNYAGTATHYAQLLGEGFLATVTHVKNGDRTYANLRKKGEPYSIRPPIFEDPETGEPRTIQIDPAISDIRLFLWNMPDLDQWDSLFISERYNPFQEAIVSADNFEGSPIHKALLEAGREIPVPRTKSAPEAPAPQGAAKAGEPVAPEADDDDPLSGIA